jgi:hypothetical protein
MIRYTKTDEHGNLILVVELTPAEQITYTAELNTLLKTKAILTDKDLINWINSVNNSI